VEIGQTNCWLTTWLAVFLLRALVSFVVSALLCENLAESSEETSMLKRFLTVSLCLLALTLPSAAQMKKSPVKKSAGPVPNKASIQKIWDGWSTLDPANVAQYYATTGPHTFFDIAPLKYNSWEEYAKGAAGLVAASSLPS
jgi:hypothetical protein